MMNKKQILSTMAAMAVLLSSNTVAFASTDVPEDGATTSTSQTIHAETKVFSPEKTAIMEARQASVEKAVKKLQEQGTLSQEEADNILENSDFGRMQTHALERMHMGEVQPGEEGFAIKDDAGTMFFRVIERGEAKELNAKEAKEKIFREDGEGGVTITMAVQASDGEVADWNDAMLNDITWDDAGRHEIAAASHVFHADFLTDEQSTALRDEIQNQFEIALQELVDQGEITQEDADQCKERKSMMFKSAEGMKPVKLERQEVKEEGAQE